MRWVALFVLLVSNLAKSETWHCSKPFDTTVLVLLSSQPKENTGEIQVAGITHSVKYSVQGFNRRWDFGFTGDSGYRYAFVIGPDGGGQYYDFKIAKRSMVTHTKRWTLTVVQSDPNSMHRRQKKLLMNWQNRKDWTVEESAQNPPLGTMGSSLLHLACSMLYS